VEAGRIVLDEEEHRLVDFGRADHVVVVQHEHDLLVGRSKLVDE